ncbi:hypothetical protein NE850_00155 [Paraburkholderia sp. USG1]|uniref:LPD7 domain-containing protein n=1 Tax=Paraburkholderia sp. USG1 TaxID=2952268 RepID=UPI0028611B3A|nr:LPD7 domain-containing protein [Paraburkholderia sp. USG1]MDR8394739.1 hypothetical protein [Paraburkholderia sp. USG1]
MRNSADANTVTAVRPSRTNRAATVGAASCLLKGESRGHRIDEHVFTDSGRQVGFSSYRAAPDAMVTGLLLVREKFGRPLDAGGDAAFGAKMVDLVIEYGLDVRFSNAALEAQREKLEAAHSCTIERSYLWPSILDRVGGRLRAAYVDASRIASWFCIFGPSLQCGNS